jgi:hypothetical protein
MDTDLRLLCFEWHALRAVENTPVSNGIDCEDFFAARARRRVVTNQIMAIRPSTTGKRQTLARVVVTLVDDGEFPIHAASTACIRG